MKIKTTLIVLFCALRCICALTDIDVIRVPEETVGQLSRRAEKFPSFTFCGVKGERDSSDQIVAYLRARVTYVDARKKKVQLHLELSEVISRSTRKIVVGFPGTYALEGFNIEPSYDKEKLKEKLEEEMVCGLFSGNKITILETKTIYVIKYFKVKKEKWWCDVYDYDSESYEMYYFDTDECTVLEKDLDVMSRSDLTVDSPTASESKLVPGQWERCSTETYPDRGDKELCPSIGGVKTIIRFYCPTQSRETIGFKLIHLYGDKEIGSYTVSISETIQGPIFNEPMNTYLCRLFRFKIENDEKIHIQYLSLENITNDKGETKTWFKMYCDAFEKQKSGEYKKVATTNCNRYRGEGVYHMYTPFTHGESGN